MLRPRDSLVLAVLQNVAMVSLSPPMLLVICGAAYQEYGYAIELVVKAAKIGSYMAAPFFHGSCWAINLAAQAIINTEN